MIFSILQQPFGGNGRPYQATRRFFHIIAMLIVLLFGINVLIAWTAKRSQRHRLLDSIAQLAPATDCICLGNSLVEAGCDAAVLEAAWPKSRQPFQAVNLALGATSPVEHYLILKRALAQPIHPKYLIYGFFDDQLNSPVRGDWSDLIGNRALSYDFPAAAAALYAPDSRLKRWELQSIGHIPMLSERASLWAKVEMLRRRLEDIGLPQKPVTRFGRVEDFAALEAKDADEFSQRCAAEVQHQTGFSGPIRQLVELARQHGLTVILVEMPMPTRHRRLFYSSPAWRDLRAYDQSLSVQHGALYLDASDWAPDESNFDDATHLSERGAALFSRRLAAVVAGAAKPGNGG